ncbi:hypothetical protein HD806DRAFT_495749 [Xylariaceae sp. AK1471]|nr:hypothetical protein HD806DRAFT_495749 [Xylariaceae sp. AK1471]
MPRPPGEPAGSMKWHRLRYPERPGTFVELGAVLTDPYEVEDSLTQEEGVVPVPEGYIKDVSEAAVMAISTHLSTETESHLKGLFPLHLLANVGGSVGGGSERAIERIVRACNVQATVFRPSEAYMDDVMKKQVVTGHLQKSWLGGGKLYIIVGVAKAQNLTVDDSTNRGRQAGVTAIASVPLAGVEIDTGLTHKRNSGAAIGYTIDHEVTFAYRVKEFKYSKIRKRLKDQGHVTDGAMLGTEEDQDRDSVVPIATDYDFEFEGFPEDEGDDDDDDDNSSAYGSDIQNDNACTDKSELDFWVET